MIPFENLLEKNPPFKIISTEEFEKDTFEMMFLKEATDKFYFKVQGKWFLGETHNDKVTLAIIEWNDEIKITDFENLLKGVHT